MSGGFSWSWSDYEREANKFERATGERAARPHLKAPEREPAPDIEPIDETPPQGFMTADSAGGCEASPPEGPIRPAEARVVKPVNGEEPRAVFGPDGWDAGQSERADLDPVHDQPAKPRTRIGGRAGAPADPPRKPHPTVGEKIDISQAPSAMEQMLDQPKALEPLVVPEEPSCDGHVVCKCGARRQGSFAGLVPIWFGEKCIEAECPLRGAA